MPSVAAGMAVWSVCPTGREAERCRRGTPTTTARFAAECQSFLRPSSMPSLCAGFRTCRLVLITVWLPVRVLPAPPRTPMLTEISRGLTNTRGFAGAQGRLAQRLGHFNLADKTYVNWRVGTNGISVSDRAAPG